MSRDKQSTSVVNVPDFALQTNEFQMISQYIVFACFFRIAFRIGESRQLHDNNMICVEIKSM